MIYADNAATTELDIEAFEAMRQFLLDEYGNASQPYSFGIKARKAISESRQLIAECIGADPDEVFFTSCGTESDNWAIKMGSTPGKKIVTSAIEHHAILNSCIALEKQRIETVYIPVNGYGEIIEELFERAIKEDASLASIMFANNEIGTIQKVKELAAIAHRYGVLFHTDAVQAVGHIEIDVHELDVDMLSASAHKFNGPKGIGFLYIKKGTRIDAFINGGSQEAEMRAGTENVASIVAMASALKSNCKNLYENEKHIKNLEKDLIGRLNIAGVDYIRNGSKRHIPGNISLSFRGQEGEMILHRMDLKDICISTGSACDSVNSQVSHVIKAIGVPNEYANGTIRISLGKNNTFEEVKNIANTLISIIN